MLGTFKCSLVFLCARSNGLNVKWRVFFLSSWKWLICYDGITIIMHIYEYIQEVVFMLSLRFGDIYYDLLWVILEFLSCKMCTINEKALCIVCRDFSWAARGAGESVCVECVCTLVQQNGNLYMHNQSCISLKYDSKNWQTTLHFPVSTRKHSHKISACHYYSCVSVVSLSAAQLSFISHHPLTEVAFPFRFSRRCIRIIKLYKTLSTKMAIDESDHHHLRVIYAHQAPTINPSSAQIVRT